MALPLTRPDKMTSRGLETNDMVTRMMRTAIVSLLILSGCAAHFDTVGYRSELMDCVENARTLKESKDCRDDVDRRWGVK